MTETAQAIVLGGAVLGAIAYGLRLLWKGFRIMERVWTLVEHELQPNSGSSLRDRVDKTNDLLVNHLAEATSDRERLAALEAQVALIVSPGVGN